MAIYTFDQAVKKAGIKPNEVKSLGVGTNTQSEQTPKGKSSILNTAKDVVIGAGKGFTETLRSTQDLGQRILAGIDPTRNLKETRDTTGFQMLRSDDKLTDEILASKNNAQKVGKALEFVAEILYPSSKTKIATKGAETAGAILDNVGSKISGLSDDVLENGEKVKDKIIDVIEGLDDKTKTALKRTPKDLFNTFVEKGKAALKDDRIRTPLEDVGDNVINGLKQIKDRATSIAEQKTAHLDQAKIGLKRTGNIVRDAILDTQKTFSKIKIDQSDGKLVKNIIIELKNLGSNPTLKEVDKTIDLIQETLYKSATSDAVEVTNRVIGPLRNIVGKLNGKAGDIGGESYKKFNSQYKELIEIVTELNSRVGREGGGAGSFVKRLFSPSDARTKELFEKLQKFTGNDYFRDARLAKFVMDTLGDTRAANILQQIPTSAKGAIEKVIDYGAKKIVNPIKSAERFIEKNK